MGMAESFKVLAEPARREILLMLREGRMSAGEIAKRLDISPAALSYHLRQLKGADLVLEYREKNYIYYALNASVLDEIILWFGQLKQEGEQRKSLKDAGMEKADTAGEGI